MRKFLVAMLMMSLTFCGDAGSGTKSESTMKLGEWTEAGKLPSPEGFAESIGVAGAYAGFIGDYLVVAGGSNFPYGAILEGGTKEFYSDVFVFQVGEDNKLSLMGSAQLPQKLSSGATVEMGDTMFLVGGENSNGEVATIYSVKLDGTTPMISEVAQLPFTWSLGAASLQDNMLYLFAGRNNKQAVNKTWAFDMMTKEITAKADLPGEPRVQAPNVTIDGKVYIFNGLGKTIQTDNYAYDIATDTWEKLENTMLNGSPFTVSGGAAVAMSETSILVLGGVNKEVFDDAVMNLTTLKDEELEAFRQDYFNRTPEQFNFSKQEMVYDIASNTWKSIGELPFYGGAGPFPLLKKGNTVWIVSGEIKAGVRVPEIRVGKLTK